MARPWLAVVGVSAVLLLLAIPVLSLRDGHRGARSSSPRTATSGSATNSPPSSSAAAPTRSRSSPTSAAPPTAADRAAVAGFARELEATAGVSSVAPPVYAGRQRS